MRTLPTIPHLSMACVLLLALAFLPGSAASGSTSAPPLPAPRGWQWPLAGQPPVVHAFDPPAKPWLSGHRGVDLAAVQGAAIVAPTTGVVSFSGVVADRAVLAITAAGGLRISFEPAASTLQAGDQVLAGQAIAWLEGPTHCDGSSASCLHWGVRRGEEYVDPLQFVLDLRPSVLLPLIG